MTKQQPFATKLRLSKLCRGIIVLAVIKLCVLAALVADIPLPTLQWETADSSEQPRQSVNTALLPEKANLVMGSPAAPATQQVLSPTNTEPQGSAAVTAAERLHPGAHASVTMPVSTATKEKADSPSNQSPAPLEIAASPAAPPAVPATTTLALLPSGVEAAPAVESPWWQNMLQLKKLPIPHMGVAQVAHAAALDTPPAPTVPQPTGSSPFTPPAQQIMRGQDANGNPLPPRSTTAKPLPAGSNSPLAIQPAPTNSVDPMTTPVPPPAPKVNAYSPPEDPNRKQQELARREQEILVLKQQMEQRLQELQSAELRVKGMLKDAQEVEGKKLSSLIAVYANMKPKQAAQTLQSLDERVAVKILTGLSPKQAGEILSYADPKTTAKLTELMTRMHMQP
ncbi:MAG: hypothetical protein RRY29_00770 [Desulfovibrionaceae bacterium]